MQAATQVTGVVVPSVEKKLSMPFLLGMAAYLLGINYVWISFSSILLPLQVEAVVPAAQKGLAVGLIAAISIGIGILFNIVAGIYSDHMTSSWGRRTPTILAGAVLTIPCILLSVIFPPSLIIVFLTFFGQQFFTNVSSGAYQPLLADLVPENQRGSEAGLQGVATLIGSALSFLLTGLLVSRGQMPLALVFLAVGFALTTLVTLGTIRQVDRAPNNLEPVKILTAIREMFHVTQKATGFFWFVIASFAIFMGVTSFQYFGIYYFETVLKMPNPAEAMSITGLINLVVTMIATMAAGMLSDRFGRRNMIIAAAALAGLINLAFPFVPVFALFVGVACLYSIMMGIFFSVNMALASDLVPKTESGKFMAYNNLAVGMANVLSPMIGGLVLSFGAQIGFNSFLVLFIVASLYFFVGTGLMFKVPKR